MPTEFTPRPSEPALRATWTSYVPAIGGRFLRKLRWLSLVVLLPAGGAFPQLIAYYPFDNGSANDASGNGFNPTCIGGTPTASGYAGGAFVFDGTSSSYLQIDSLNINPGVYPALTMGAWVATNEVGPIIRPIISHDNGSFDRSLGLDYCGGLNGWSTFLGGSVLGGQTATVGAWTFVAVSYDQSAGTAMLYINGATYTASGACDGGGYDFIRIASNPGFGEFFQRHDRRGFLFSSALTASQLDHIRLNGVMAAVPEATTTSLLLGVTAAVGAATRWKRPGRRSPEVR
jgi:hypothetical protein